MKLLEWFKGHPKTKNRSRVQVYEYKIVLTFKAFLDCNLFQTKY